jgi:hypothetical protein
LKITDGSLVDCGATRDTAAVIKSFRHKGSSASSDPAVKPAFNQHMPPGSGGNSLF